MWRSSSWIGVVLGRLTMFGATVDGCGSPGTLLGIAAINLIKVKKPFHRLLLKLIYQDCRLSERRFDFHNMRVSGEKTAWFKSPPPRPRPCARISSEHHDAFGSRGFA